MFILRGLLLLIIPLFWIFGLEYSLSHSEYWYYFVGSFGVLIALTLFILGKIKLRRNFLNFFILPLFFYLSVCFFIAFLEREALIHAMVIFSGLTFYVYFRQYYLYFYFPFKYQPYSLESLSFYLNIFAIFFASTALFSAHLLLKFNLWLLLLILLTLVFALTYQFYWINKISFSKTWLIILAVMIVCAELFVALAYLPTGYFVNSFTLSLGYFLMLSLGKHFLRDSLDRRRLISYLTISSICLIIVLATARWY